MRNIKNQLFIKPVINHDNKWYYQHCLQETYKIFLDLFISLIVSGRYPENPAIWLVPGAGSIFLSPGHGWCGWHDKTPLTMQLQNFIPRLLHVSSTEYESTCSTILRNISLSLKKNKISNKTVTTSPSKN